MFEAAELGRTVAKEEYKARVPALRIELLEAQRQLTDARFPVIVVFQGVDGAGKGETVNLLNEWMDPRWIVTRAYGEPSDEESERPEYWRYWRDLPRKGRLGLFLSSRYSRPLLDRVYRRNGSADFDKQLDRIAGFERTLTDDGALILKFWMHLGKNAQKKHLRSLEKDRLTRWRVTKLQWQHWRMYDKFVAAAERALQRTSTVQAPWTIVEGVDEAHRSLTVATTILDAVRKALAEGRGVRVVRPKSASAKDVQSLKVAGKATTNFRRGQDRGRRGAADDLEQPRHVAGADQEGVLERTAEVPGTVESPSAQGAGARAVDDHGVRGAGRGG